MHAAGDGAHKNRVFIYLFSLHRSPLGCAWCVAKKDLVVSYAKLAISSV